jgi:AcrR family transcriptional regulator
MDRPYTAVRYARNVATKKRLSRQDWIDAALVMGAESGFDKIAVEVLAPRLGATRGSFYWHFSDRAELINAVLAEWEELATAQIIEGLDQLPVDQALAGLIGVAFGATTTQDGAEWRLIAACDDPLIGPCVARVHRLRLGFIEKVLGNNGATASEASERARVAYAAYVGSLALRYLDPDGPNLGPALLRLLD